MPQNITSKPVRKSAARPGVKHLSALVEACIEAVRERNAAHPAQTFSLEPVNPVRIVFAFSGGRDSTALLDVLAKIYQDARQTSIADLTVVHVHHGLSPNADAWVSHVRSFCAKRSLKLEVEKVYVNPHAAEGVEAAARQARTAPVSGTNCRLGMQPIKRSSRPSSA